MRKIVAAEYLTLDGVMEEPAWTAPYWSKDLSDLQHDLLFASDALLLGRITYEGFSKAWPGMKDEDGFAERINSLPKHVASTTLKELEWNASLIDGDVVEAVETLKQQKGANLLIYGSATLVQSLMQHGLIDEYRLMIHPLSLGAGKKLFAEGSEAKLKLVDTTVIATGVVVLTYQSERA